MHLEKLTPLLTNAVSELSNSAFQTVASSLGTLKENIREEIRRETLDEIREIIRKLEGNKPLLPAELETMKLWIIGDAASYTKIEKNFQHWLDDYKQSLAELKTFEDRELSIQELSKLEGILEETTRICFDISNFLEQKERIEKFEATTRNITNLDMATRKLLAQFISSKM
ncbi:hypothetical protein JW935_07995 [candidate division KSB1 bacterium]|nr:hypothetical protein [candidate division KSB1 bacterium]